MRLPARVLPLLLGLPAVVWAPAASAVTIQNAIFRESFGLAFEGLPRFDPGFNGELSGADDTAQERLPFMASGTNSRGEATSISGFAETKVVDVSGLVPQTEARSVATFENLRQIDGGEGPAYFRNFIEFEFAIVPLMPGAPTGVPLSVDFGTTLSASVTGLTTDFTSIGSNASLELRRLTGNLTTDFQRLDVSIQCGDSTVLACTGSSQVDTITRTLTMSFVPDTDKARLVQRTNGFVSVSSSTDDLTTGSYEAFVDPIIQFTPGATVDVNGVPTPLDQAYGVTVSPNVILSEPLAGVLLAAGLGWAVRRRRQA